jgi:beta-glucosidase
VVTSDEVVQAYVTTPHASVPAPRLRLVDFERVRNLAPGAGPVTVRMLLTPQYLSVVREEGLDNFWRPSIEVEAGQFVVHVGGGQPGERGVSICDAVHAD